MYCVKDLVESGGSLQSVPSKYIFPENPEDCIISDAETIPIIDFSLLTSASLKQRSKVIHELGTACREWGFFMVINHGVKKTLRDEMIKACQSFFDLPTEEKRDYAGKKFVDPIRWGTSFNTKVDKTYFWRDYLKVHVHPQFNAPQKPVGFSEIVEEYCKQNRELASELLKGISASLGLEENYIQKTLNVGSNSHQLLVINSYPACPQPELVMGLPPHSDHGLLTIIMQNDLGGLQVQHDGKWVPVNPPPDSFVVNVGDQLEILTNGIYKSILHRAMVNSKATRISVGTANGPPLDTVVSPAPELVDRENQPARYRPITYRQYVEFQQSNHLDGKSCLSHVFV
ncbi:2-oxoglutarate-dependent dioxygenase 19-like [Mangifera indica]|uniref:2-oxoglutarate-dependent dioxygenase 19-like n=1 Tax=Mangifera indica TaxID=29780 RepID=UPI001CFA5DCB|nr:2-oxoglutarate-dependent dioxygenase 19-like [Mangifera indica]